MEDNQSFFDLQINEEAGSNLLETARWTRFLGVTVLASTAIMVLLFVTLWSRMEELIKLFEPVEVRDAAGVKMVLAAVLVFLVAIVAILMTFLLKGARAIRLAVQQKDSALFTIGLGHLRNYLAMLGVINLIGLLFTLLGLVTR